MNPSIKVIPFPGIKNASVIISATWHNDKLSKNERRIKKNMSFFYDGGNGVGVEWEPDYGPLTTIERCDKNHPKAEPHFIYPFCTGHGEWAQLIVDEYGLPDLFLAGGYAAIFRILAKHIGQ